MKTFKAKWGLVIKALALVIPIIGLKILFHRLEWDIVPVGTLTSALVTGVFFVIAIILAGVLTDFKESEKMLGEFTASIETLYNDTRLIGTEAEISGTLSNVRNLIHIAVVNFERHDNWKLGEVNPAIEQIDEDIRRFNAQGKPLSILLRMRSELANIKRISYRVEAIKETTFMPVAHAIVQAGVAGIVLVLTLSTIAPFYEGLLLVGVLSLIMISVVLLIRDMDNPFEGYATIDLRLIHKLEDFLNRKQSFDGGALKPNAKTIETE